MSRPRVITGVDERGRPKATWADPEPDASRGYGFMEPALAATVERRQATPEELEAARAREAEPSHLTTNNARSLPHGALTTTARRAAMQSDAERMQTSRQRGAERHVEVLAGRKTTPDPERPPEEAIVSEPHADHAETIPGDSPAVDVGLDRLAMAAEGARTAWDAKAAADTAWTIAREALAAAYAEVEWVVEPLPAPPDDDHVRQVITVPLVAPVVVDEPEPAPASPPSIDIATASVEEVAAARSPGAIGGGSGATTQRPGTADRRADQAPGGRDRPDAVGQDPRRDRAVDGHDLPDDRRAARGRGQEEAPADRADPAAAGPVRQVHRCLT